ncbi:NYN domain, limkain-b1-type [Phaffia rhodozyma]|uniref:NYN domain, limkain-b1-type n=1 Tax=Phaffia rhodozyma TaxID=264483 RepID=A0A0F7SU28_PHARH|nr:NYN domain, limkain-b1-type [Phaffia rhodozyma]
MDTDHQIRQLQQDLDYERRARQIDQKLFDQERSHHLQAARSASAFPASSIGSPTTWGSQKPLPVAIFWDYENCSPPLATNPSLLVKHLRKIFQPFGPISFIRCYQDVGAQPVFAQTLRSGLEACAVEVRDCGRWGRKDVADHHIMTDIFMYALDNPAPATIVLISGDKDFSYILANLCNRQYNVILVENQIGAAEELKSSASQVYKWRELLRDAGASKGASLPPTLPISSIPAPIVFPTPRRTRSNSDPNVSPSAIPTALHAKPDYESRPVLNKTSSSSTMIAPVPVSTTTPTLGGGFKISAFGPLLDVLKGWSAENPPLRSAISPLVLKKDINAFARAGAGSWKDYVDKAESAGLVVLASGPKPGMETIALTKVFANNGASSRSTVPPSSPISFNPIIPNSLSKLSRASSLSQSITASHLESFAPDQPKAPDSTSTSPILSARRRLLTNTLAKSTDDSIRSTYQPLIDVLSVLPSSPPPHRYVVSQLLKTTTKGSELVSRFGWKPYVEKAQDHGFVRTGGSVDDPLGQWMELMPAFKSTGERVPFDKKTPVPPFAIHTAETFRPLLLSLGSLPLPSSSGKTPAALISRVAGQLKSKQKEAFQLVGVGNFKDYLDVAIRLGVIRCGKGVDESGDWVALKKEYRGLAGYGVPAPRVVIKKPKTAEEGDRAAAEDQAVVEDGSNGGETKNEEEKEAKEDGVVGSAQATPTRVVSQKEDVNRLFASIHASPSPAVSLATSLSRQLESGSDMTETALVSSSTINLPPVKETTALNTLSSPNLAPNSIPAPAPTFSSSSAPAPAPVSVSAPDGPSDLTPNLSGGLPPDRKKFTFTFTPFGTARSNPHSPSSLSSSSSPPSSSSSSSSSSLAASSLTAAVKRGTVKAGNVLTDETDSAEPSHTPSPSTSGRTTVIRTREGPSANIQTWSEDPTVSRMEIRTGTGTGNDTMDRPTKIEFQRTKSSTTTAAELAAGLSLSLEDSVYFV